jgi:hypothetical protein
MDAAFDEVYSFDVQSGNLARLRLPYIEFFVPGLLNFDS